MDPFLVLVLSPVEALLGLADRHLAAKVQVKKAEEAVAWGKAHPGFGFVHTPPRLHADRAEAAAAHRGDMRAIQAGMARYKQVEPFLPEAMKRPRPAAPAQVPPPPVAENPLMEAIKAYRGY